MTQPIRNAVTLVVDGREVIAPEGTMLVDAAKRGDVEIPVFCYEPKLGEPVGACRMCLVEIEGIPKLQTACSTPVRDGMVVYTQTDQVKEAQNAVVEFLLVNHPLDCPVCDKGGECPLQDIAMGWGPGKSRFTDPKRHFQKPLELSPLVAIDRERCILCYRCVRFSQEVAEDEQLQLLERGDRSFVGTFDERPYIAPFHGNIIELCPVGALTSYTYRFRARPWDIEQAGSVCTLCPSQCNVSFTVRDEHVHAGARPRQPRRRRRLALRQGPLRLPDVRLRGPDHRADGARRRRHASARSRWDEAIAQGRRPARRAPARSRRRWSAAAPPTRRAGWSRGSSARPGRPSDRLLGEPGRRRACSAELSRPELSSRIADLDYAGAILVLGTDPLHEMPILDLRIRKAVRRGRREARWSPPSARPRSTAAPTEAVRYAPGEAGGVPRRPRRRARRRGPRAPRARTRRRPTAIAEQLRGVPDPVIVWGERLWRSPAPSPPSATCARALGMHQRIGPGLLEVPEEANGRGLREVGCLPGAGPGLAAADAGRDADRDQGGPAPRASSTPCSCSTPTRSAPTPTPTAGARPSARPSSSRSRCSTTSRPSTPNIVLPAETHAEKEGTVTHPDGRLQRLRPQRPAPGRASAPAGRSCASSQPRWAATSSSRRPRTSSSRSARRSPSTARLHYEEIGGRGLRWQERDPGTVLDARTRGGRPGSGAAAALRRQPA